MQWTRWISRRIWPLLLLALAVSLVACTTSPQDVTTGRSRIDPSGAPVGQNEQAGQAGGLKVAAARGPGGDLAVPAGVYLASLVVADMVHEQGVPLAVLPNAGNFAAGQVRFIVLNKWGGLGIGAHRQSVRVVTPDGAATLAADETEFTVTPEHVYITIASPINFQADAAGFYQVVVTLDGQDVASYRFRIRSGQ